MSEKKFTRVLMTSTKSENTDEGGEVDDSYFQDDGDSPDFNDDIDIGAILSNFFVTEDGTNIAEALVGIKKSLDTHNKLMMKLLVKNA
jgi:hypothetical protein